MNQPVASNASIPTTAEQRHFLSRIVRAFPSLFLRAYCRIRFLIIGPRFLNIIGQYLPERGDMLEIGCGFGLSGLYFSCLRSECVIHGYDLDRGRIKIASAAAKTLGLNNVHFSYGDAACLVPERTYEAAYAIDIIHHLPRETVPKFLEGIYERLQLGGRFIIKDVDDTPAFKRWISWVTDRVMVGPAEPLHYWPVEELRVALRDAGFTACAYRMPDILPYPHVLYVCEKQSREKRQTR